MLEDVADTNGLGAQTRGSFSPKFELFIGRDQTACDINRLESNAILSFIKLLDDARHAQQQLLSFLIKDEPAQLNITSIFGKIIYI